ncbi:hypothetical protein C8R45DRAFT_940625 [Mycena sanguinolenta]|nr:hypothetical protein C8R45DRAFT_940625 [Mycena sanguinolenta]
MPTDLPVFAASHLKQDKWKQTTPRPCTSSNALEKCVAEFHLIDAKPSTAWADKIVEDDLKEFERADQPAVYEKIDKALRDVLSCIDLGDAAPAMHDCIVPLSIDLADDGWVACQRTLFSIGADEYRGPSFGLSHGVVECPDIEREYGRITQALEWTV